MSELQEQLLDALCHILVGGRSSRDIVSSETGEIIIVAGRSLTREQLKRYVKVFPYVEWRTLGIEPIKQEGVKSRSVATELRSIATRLRRLASQGAKSSRQ